MHDADTRAETPRRGRRRGLAGVQAAGPGTGAGGVGTAAADAGVAEGGGGGLRDTGGHIQMMDHSSEELWVRLSVEAPQKKGAPDAVEARSLASAMGLRSMVVEKAAERAGGVRDEQGLLWVGHEAWKALARHLGRTAAHVGRMAVRAEKRRRPLDDGCEVVRVVQVPGRNRVLVAVRMGSKVAGERVTVEVRDTLAYRIGEEIVAKKGRLVYVSQEGR